MERQNIGAGNKVYRVTSSVILPSTTDENKFIYVLTDKDKKWGLPAGKLEPFEHPLDGAVREILEETGLTAVINGVVSIFPFKSVRGNPIFNVVYYGDIVEGVPIAKRKEGILDVRAYSLSEVRSLYSNGELRGRANLEPLEIFYRNKRQCLPVSTIGQVIID